jgi:hypothetical protein
MIVMQIDDRRYAQSRVDRALIARCWRADRAQQSEVAWGTQSRIWWASSRQRRFRGG